MFGGVDDEGLLIDPATAVRGGVEGAEEFLEGELIDASVRVGFRTIASGNGDKAFATVEEIAFGFRMDVVHAGDDLIDPSLEEGWHIVPLDGELEDEGFCGEEALDFCFDIDLAIRVEFIEMGDFHSADGCGSVDEGAVGAGFGEVGVRENDLNFCHCGRVNEGSVRRRERKGGRVVIVLQIDYKCDPAMLS